MSDREWTLKGRITRVVSGHNEKTGRAFQMVQVGGFSFFLEPEQFDSYIEGEEVIVSGLFVRDVRNQAGKFEPVQLLHGIERVNGAPIPRVSKGAPAPL